MPYLDIAGLSHLASRLKTIMVPQSRKINSKTLAADITLTGDDITGLVKTVNGAAPDENGNVTVDTGSGGSGTVKSVNAVDPDEDGNITLIAADIPMAGDGSPSVGDILTPTGPAQVMVSNEVSPGVFEARMTDTMSFSPLQYLNRPSIDINGGLAVWQRGESFISSQPGYTADRMYVGYTGARCDIVKGQPRPGSLANASIRMQNPAENASIVFASTWYENPEKYAGQTMTFSVMARATPGVPITVQINSNNVTIPESIVTTIAASEWTLFRKTITIPSGTMTLARVALADFTEQDSSAYAEFSEFQFVFGDAVGLFIPRPHAQELALCQRYALSIDAQAKIRSAYTSPNYFDFFIPTPTTMRTVPTIPTNNMAIYTTTGALQTGFTFAVILKSSIGVLVRATKAAHGLTDAFIDVAASGVTILDAEIYP